jgi:tRNA(Ile)-lysidine synthase
VIKRIKKLIKEKELLKGVNKVIIGYSGGPDSTLLVEVLSDYDNLQMILAYFNHNLRKDSKEEENFVIKEAKKRNLTLLIEGADVKEYCERASLSIEEGARDLRLSYLRSAKQSENADLIALGHNLDDKIENFFIRLLRGSGFGLSHMGYLDGDILRPLLDSRKHEIMEYLRKNKIAFYTDPTNKSDNYLRNKIRLKLIPTLEQIQEGAEESINRTIDNLSDIEKALEEYVDSVRIIRHLNYAEIDRKDFEKLPSACKFLILKKMLSIFNGELELKRAHIINLPERGIVNLKSVSLELTHARVIIAKNIFEKEKGLPLSGEIAYVNYNIETEVMSPPAGLKVKGFEFFDLDCLELPLKVRSKKNGDKMVAFGNSDTKKIKDIFINSKIPRILRDNYPIICDSKEIIMVPGIKRSNRAPVLEKTKKILKIGYKEVMDAGEKR